MTSLDKVTSGSYVEWGISLVVESMSIDLKYAVPGEYGKSTYEYRLAGIHEYIMFMGDVLI